MISDGNILTDGLADTLEGFSVTSWDILDGLDLNAGHHEGTLGPKFFVPLCIMVSDDTHDRTVKILEENDYFGLDKSHVDLVKQENVPALLDNDGNMAL